MTEHPCHDIDRHTLRKEERSSRSTSHVRVETLNPDHLVTALHQLAPKLAPDFAAFTRQEVYTEDMQIFR